MLMILMLIGAMDVIARYLFTSPIKGSLGLSEVLLVGVVFFAWAYTESVDGNVKVEIFCTQFRPRTQCIAGAFKKLIAVVIFGIMTWQSVIKAAESMDSMEIIDVLDIPAYPFHLFVTLGVGVLCLQLIVDFLGFLKPGRGA
jgi:TRAP-type C4-dicarboxylate transport system permease small subunit